MTELKYILTPLVSTHGLLLSVRFLVLSICDRTCHSDSDFPVKTQPSAHALFSRSCGCRKFVIETRFPILSQNRTLNDHANAHSQHEEAHGKLQDIRLADRVSMPFPHRSFL